MSNLSKSAMRAASALPSPLAHSTSHLAQLYAWIAMLVVGPLTTIIWATLLGRNGIPAWDPYVRLGCLLSMVGLTWLWPTSLRPLRGFLFALLALVVGTMTASFFMKLPTVTSWLQTLQPSQYVFVDAIGAALFPAGFMALTLIGSGLSRHDLSLAKGNMSARSRLFGPLTPALPWPLLAPILLVILVIPGLVQVVLTVHPDLARASNILSALPLILAFGLINSLQEEFRFRLVFLARLVPVVGERHALLLTSVLFGLVHWVSGHPGGPVGALIAGCAGWFLAKSIRETGGIGWAWLLHGVADVLIITLLVMATVLR